MALPFGIATAVAVFVVVAAIGILTSRTAIERLVGIGMLPRLFISAVPLLTVVGRALAVAMILFGAIELGLTTGILSQQWLEHYGFSALLITLGVILFFLTFRKASSG
jgi:hypothetical protein